MPGAASGHVPPSADLAPAQVPAGSRRQGGAWARSLAGLLAELGTSATSGLAPAVAERRLSTVPRLAERKRHHALRLLLRQFLNPIVLILIGAAIVSLLLGGTTDAVIILIIVAATGGLGFLQEHRAARAMAALLERVRARSTVIRDGQAEEVPSESLVRGDLVQLQAGDLVPADCRVSEARDLFVDESSLTGESLPVEKRPGELPPATTLAARTNMLHEGSHVISGWGRAVVVATGRQTEVGQLASTLATAPPKTEFERGLERFGLLLLEATLCLLVLLFASSIYFHRPPLQALLFAVALAVGLTPQLLPAVVTVNLAQGAARMSRRRVIVRRLESIENLGSLEIFCTDKTGTLTETALSIAASIDPLGRPSPATLRAAQLNARFESGYKNPIDDALRAQPLEGPSLEAQPVEKLDEIPYDFTRRRLAILVREPAGDAGAAPRLLVKGAVANVLEVASAIRLADGPIEPLASRLAEVTAAHEALSRQGFRVLAVAERILGPNVSVLAHEDERDLVLLGFVALASPLKAGIQESLGRLRSLGVEIKIITGDNRLSAAYVARSLGLTGDDSALITGAQIDQLTEGALVATVRRAVVFAEIEPRQKRRLVMALKAAGFVVGYMGDGINDVAALHAADVSISVDSAVDVARLAADIVLLEPDVGVVADGVAEGRRTFANTLKYVYMATSANFGNMVSMVGASLLVPFLPLLPKQVLLTNLLTDLPEMAIATDWVDEDRVRRPRRWDIHFVRRFMLAFGLLSSAFDFATFLVLRWLAPGDPALFRSGWFVESVLSASLAVLVIRTELLAWQSRPSPWLFGGTLAVVGFTALLPYSPLGGVLGFQPLPPLLFVLVLSVVAVYLASCEGLKRLFFRAPRSASRHARAAIRPLRRSASAL